MGFSLFFIDSFFQFHPLTFCYFELGFTIYFGLLFVDHHGLKQMF